MEIAVRQAETGVDGGDGRPPVGVGWRVGRTFAICGFVAASLLTFPSVIPAMVALWLVWYTAAVVRGRVGWFPLVGCVAILLVKGLHWLPGMIVLANLMVAVAVIAVAAERARNNSWLRRIAWLGVPVLWIAWAGMAVEWHAAAHCSREVALEADRPVVCIGDSLTSGVAPYGSYSKDLQDLLSIPVVDLGIPGITTDAALAQLPALVAARPQVVVIELGGHDYLRGHTRSSTKANLETIIAASREIGAEVVLMEVPRGFMIDAFDGIERELAREHDLELVPDTAIRKLVLWSRIVPPGRWTNGPHFSEDGLHPNGHGNKVLADYVAALVRLYGDEVRRRGGK